MIEDFIKKQNKKKQSFHCIIIAFFILLYEICRNFVSKLKTESNYKLDKHPIL